MLLLLVSIPVLLAALALAMPWRRARPWLLPLCGIIHLGMTLVCLTFGAEVGLSGWLALDALGRLTLLLVSVLFFVAALYAPSYLLFRAERDNRVFVAGLLFVLGSMTLVIAAQHLGLLWVAMEATALATAPLIYFNKNPRSIEATWKYLLIGSVGVALALLGTFFMAYAELVFGLKPSLLLGDLLRAAPSLSKPWLHAAFILLFVGYGTKMGLAPMHSWKPDAYGEAPGVVGVVLSGGVTSCAFVALLRFVRICHAAGEGAFAERIMVACGLLSVFVAAVFMVRQQDLKRLLAYSSVEHMGILVLGVGLGGAGVFGAMLHMVNNALVKGVLFLSAGNIHRAFRSKVQGEVRGALRLLPISSALFLAGFFAISGSPPFSPFVSVLAIVKAGVTGGHYVTMTAFLAGLLLVFLGMGKSVLEATQGEPPAVELPANRRDHLLSVLPPVLLLALALGLGLYLPPSFLALVRDAAAFVSVTP